ncbi:MAG: VanW family protein [Candidatus Moranbacteria bacterium]|nr:VanW family protein [Candidatus Moranbacteria bacterium]
MSSIKLLLKFLLIFLLLTTAAVFPPDGIAKANESPGSSEENFPFKKLVLKIGPYEEIVSENVFPQWIGIKSALYFPASSKSEIENTSYCPGDHLMCDFSVAERERSFTKKTTHLELKKEEIQSFLKDLERKVNKDPMNAKFQVENNKVSAFSLSENGFKLDVSKSHEALLKSLLVISIPAQETREIELFYNILESEIKSDAIDTLGITTLIGEGRSNFRGSPKNRIHNIKIGSSRFNGILIKPEEEFSFVKTLGPVDSEHGYTPELVIKKDKTEPEFGGGICQISTTAFRAAIYSGLEITARRNHAYPVAYYNPQGIDATVYIPRPDLRFINNTPGYILIQTKIEGTELIFQFYGVSDGRTVEIEGPKVLERNPDGSMKTTFTQIVKDKDGNVILKDVFNSSYDSPAKYPHPGEEKLTEKPDDWSNKEWKKYKEEHGM